MPCERARGRANSSTLSISQVVARFKAPLQLSDEGRRTDGRSENRKSNRLEGGETRKANGYPVTQNDHRRWSVGLFSDCHDKAASGTAKLEAYEYIRLNSTLPKKLP